MKIVVIVMTMCCIAYIGGSQLLASPIYEDSLVKYWEFDEGSGDVLGDSAGDNDGTLENNPVWATGQYDGALSFNGVNEYVNIPYSESLNFGQTSSFTIFTWATVDNINNYRSIIAHTDAAYRGWNLMIMSSQDPNRPSALSLLLTNTNNGNDLIATSPSHAVSAGNTYHMVATYSGNSDVSGVTLYLNGIEQTVSAVRNVLTGDIQTNSDTLIGYHNYNGGSYPYDGILDGMAV